MKPEKDLYNAQYLQPEVALFWLLQEPSGDLEEYQLDLLLRLSDSLRLEIRSQSLHVLYRQTIGEITGAAELQSEALHLLQLALDALQRQVFGQEVHVVYRKNRRSLAVNMPWTQTVAVETHPGRLERVDVSGVADGAEIRIADIPLRVWRNDTEQQRFRRLTRWFISALQGRKAQLIRILKSNIATKAIETAPEAFTVPADAGQTQEEEDARIEDASEPDSRAVSGKYALDRAKLLAHLSMSDWEILIDKKEGASNAERQRYCRARARAEYVASLIKRNDKAAETLLAALRSLPDPDRKTWIDGRLRLRKNAYGAKPGSPAKVKGAQNTG